MQGHLPDAVEIGEMLAMLAVVGAMYAIVVTLMLLLAEPRNDLTQWLRETLGRIFSALRCPR